MDTKQNAAKAKRRDFLKFASVGAASGAAAAALGTTTSAEAAAPSETAAGYRETAHVKQAYELARF
jgi:hypothetical protein